MRKIKKQISIFLLTTILAIILLLMTGFTGGYVGNAKSGAYNGTSLPAIYIDCPDELILKYVSEPAQNLNQKRASMQSVETLATSAAYNTYYNTPKNLFSDSKIQIILRHRYSVGENACLYAVAQNLARYSQILREVTNNATNLSTITGWIDYQTILDTELFNQYRFNQILEIALPINCKETVLKAVAQAEQSPKVLTAQVVRFVEVKELSTPLFTPPNPLFYTQWGLHAVNMQQAWSITRGNAINVGVMEGGRVGGYFQDRYAGGNNTGFTSNHATAVAEVFAASHHNWGIAGVASNVQIFSLHTGLTESLYFAARNNIRVINASFSYISHWTVWNDHRTYFYLPGHPANVAAIQRFNGLIVAAAGNTGFNNDVLRTYTSSTANQYPANYSRHLSNVISVGATTLDVNTGQQRIAAQPDHGWAGSNWGSNWGEKTVQIWAPGTAIRTNTIAGDSRYASGTSFSAPIVAGTAALMLSTNPNLTPRHLREILADSGERIRIGHFYSSRLNAYAAVRTARDAKVIALTGPITHTATIRGGIDYSSIRFTNWDSSQGMRLTFRGDNYMLLITERRPNGAFYKQHFIAPWQRHIFLPPTNNRFEFIVTPSNVRFALTIAVGNFVEENVVVNDTGTVNLWSSFYGGATTHIIPFYGALSYWQTRANIIIEDTRWGSIVTYAIFRVCTFHDADIQTVRLAPGQRIEIDTWRQPFTRYYIMVFLHETGSSARFRMVMV